MHLYHYTNLKWCASINTKVYQSFRHLYRRGALLCVYTIYLKLNCPQIKRVLLIYTDSKLFYAAAKKYSESLSFVFLLCRSTLGRCTAVHLYNYAYVQLYVLNWHLQLFAFFTYLFQHEIINTKGIKIGITKFPFVALNLCTFVPFTKKTKGWKHEVSPLFWISITNKIKKFNIFI